MHGGEGETKTTANGRNHGGGSGQRSALLFVFFEFHASSNVRDIFSNGVIKKVGVSGRKKGRNVLRQPPKMCHSLGPWESTPK